MHFSARNAAALATAFCVLTALGAHQAAAVDLRNAVVVSRPGDLPNAERAAADVLVEEIERRTGIRLETATAWPNARPVIAITSETSVAEWAKPVPARSGDNLPETRAEGFRLIVEDGAAPVVWIVGADPRGALFGAGILLRHLDWSEEQLQIASDLDIATAPAYPIRGHQLGYRAQANSYDAWNAEQFDQHIRELTFFGVNSIENIPFHDERETPVMPVSRDEINRRMSETCERYGLDYWVWVPADFDLNDAEARAKSLDAHEALFRDCPEMTGVFFPGGDPGENPPELVLPFLNELGERLLRYHPEAGIWLSLQWFNDEQTDEVYAFLEGDLPPWFGGLAGGPSSPPIPETRNRLPKHIKHRLYPDITHNKLCQYPVPWWDQAFALTLGREAINPRPAHYTQIHNWFAPYSDGFITYSDGVHDDVNKVIFSALGWDSTANTRDILVEYSRVFFNPTVAEQAADGILALENNWRGALINNGAVEGTLKHWQALEQAAPKLESNWRWQLCLTRAYFDAYTRHRLINESQLEHDANAVLLEAESRGADTVMTEAMTVLSRAVDQPVSADLRKRIVDLCDMLYQSIGLQTSVEKYHAIGAERGAFLDFIDYPLNNRWWLEDEFGKIRTLATEQERVGRLIQIATWENPGEGSFYDDIGNVAKSPHVKRSEHVVTEHGEEQNPEPTFWWWDQGMSRARLSWQVTLDWPEAVVYEGVDPDANYIVRLTGYNQSLLRIDGEPVKPTLDGNEMGEFKEFPVPKKHLADRKLVLTWDRPDESHLNWRQRSRLSEVWLLKQTN